MSSSSNSPRTPRGGATALLLLATILPLSAAATVPLDVMVAQIQQAGAAGKKVGVLETFAAQYREGGLERVAGFATRGFALRWAHVTLTTIVIKNGTAMVTDALEARREEARGGGARRCG